MNTELPRLIVTTGDPAGIGPDICLLAARQSWPAAIAVVGDAEVMRARNEAIGAGVDIVMLSADSLPSAHRANTLQLIPVTASEPVITGQPNAANADMVLASLDLAVDACLSHRYDAMVTAPVSKALLSHPDRPFSGHTEYLAAAAGASMPVMMLCAGKLRVALATTHLPLRKVPDALTAQRLRDVVRVLHNDLQRLFAIKQPRILVCGLNPHAGESGELGNEEIEIIEPTLRELRRDGISLEGPLPADTVFVPHRLATADAVLAMYHDQGLPVLKHAGFGSAINVTLGLPVVRTSVDHGTAFDVAGSGKADPGSMHAAIEAAIEIVRHRRQPT